MIKNKYLFLIYLFIYNVLNFIVYTIFINSSCIYILNFYNILNIIIIIDIAFKWFYTIMLLILFFILFLNCKKSINIYRHSIYSNFYLILCISICLIYCINDILFFIFFFESFLLPCFIAFVYFCFSNRFIFAIYFLLLFSAITSFCCILLLCIIFLLFNVDDFLLFLLLFNTENIGVIFYILLLLLCIIFIKLPTWPFHIWLPEVHVEVSTELSIILAAIILKAGFFGLYKIIIDFFIILGLYLLGIIDISIILSLLFFSLNTFIIIDYKKIIAFWSIIHINCIIFLIFHDDIIMTFGILISNFCHVISSTALFFLLGKYYENINVRSLLILHSFCGINFITYLILIFILVNVDFPMLVCFYIEFFGWFECFNLSIIFYIYLLISNLIIFICTLYIYIVLIQYTFIWLNYIQKFDIKILEIFYFIFLFLFLFYFFIFLNFFFY